MELLATKNHQLLKKNHHQKKVEGGVQKGN